MMPIPIVLSAILPPRRRIDILTRNRLLEKLQTALEYRLILLSAPAGYGKTSLLVDFVYAKAVPTCWYTVDRTDDHLITFLGHFLAAIRHQFPQVGIAVDPILHEADQANFNLDQLVTPLVNDTLQIDATKLILVVDDFHLVSHNQRITAFISRFVQRCGDNCHLILSSRKQPALPDMELMAGRSQMIDFRPSDLLFTISEIQALIWQNHHEVISAEQAQQIHQATGGWITALLLSPPAQWLDVLKHSKSAKISGVRLYDYLSRQVLAQQSQEIQSFLLFSSLLGDFDADFCRTVLGATVFPPDTDWAAILATVASEYLLAQQIGEQGEKLRYNQLFEEFLQTQVLEKYPEQSRLVLETLAATCQQRGAWEKAFGVLKKLGDQERQAALIEAAGSTLIKQGRFKTLAQWLDQLPSSMVDHRPHLLSLKGAVIAMLQNVEMAIPWSNRAIELFEGGNDLLGLGRALARRATLLFFQGYYRETLTDAERAIELVSNQPGQQTLLADALNSKALALVWLGEPDLGLACLNQSLAIYLEHGDELNCAIVKQDMGIAYRNMGDYPQARDAYQQALAVWEKIGDLHRAASVQNNLGALSYYDGNYEVAIRHYQDALKLARQSGYGRIEGYALIGLGDLYADLGATVQAQRAYAEAAKMPATANSSLMFHVHLGEARLARIKQDWTAADASLQAAQATLERYPSGYEQGLYVLETGVQALSRGHAQQAEPLFEKAIELLGAAKKAGETAQAFFYLSAAQYTLKRSESKETLKQAFAASIPIKSQHVLVIPGLFCKTLLKGFQSDPDLKAQVEMLLARIEQMESSKTPLLQRMRQTIHVLPAGPARLVVKGFGEGQVYMDGRLITNVDCASVIGKEVLFYMLSYPDGLSRSDAAAIFWPENTATQLSAALRNIRYCLRKAFSQDIFAPAEDRLVFNFAFDYQYDVEDFQRLIGLSKSDREQSQTMLEEAIGLYTDHFLTNTWRDWANPIRDDLLRQYVMGVADLTAITLQERKYEASREYCLTALRFEPAAEIIHQQLMRIYAAMGLRTDVAKQYQLCSQALEELGFDLSQETEKLYMSLTQ